MDSNSIENLFWDIFLCKDEDEVDSIIKKNKYLSDDNNWHPYGDTKGNFGTFETQQPHPIAALVEKLTNSIDSMLLKECRVRNIDPKSESAPKSMPEAVHSFFNIKNGNLGDLLPKERRALAENIRLIAEGEKDTPNLIVIDNGEGQLPDDFSNTFLSLSKNNKSEIHFVQGKYNFGSTGAVVFCGENRYQLIMSKLNDKLIKNNKAENQFGFTLVRRHPFKNKEEEDKHRFTWYEYFVVNKKIPRFNKDKLSFNTLGLDFLTGSLVKLFSYQLPPGAKSDITRILWEELNQFLFAPALPIVIEDKRFSRDPVKTPPKPMLGNFTRLYIDDREKVEKSKFKQISDNDIGNLKLQWFVFKSKDEADNFVRKKPVIYTLNGQIHGIERKTFISQELNYPLLKDCLLFHIDCTEIRPSFRQDLFMANRYNMKESRKYYQFKDLIIEKLKEDEELRKCNQNKKDKLLGDSSICDDEIKNLFESIPIDNDLLKLLNSNGDLNIFLNFSKGQEIIRPERETGKNKKLNRYPSIFKINLKKNQEAKKIKSIPLNGRGTIKFETDVMDDYLYRPDDRGELTIKILEYKPIPNNTTGGEAQGRPNKIEEVIEVTKDGPNDGVIKVTFKPKKHLNVGDELKVETKLTSPNGDTEVIFYIQITNEQNQDENVRDEKKDQPSLPKPIKVFKTCYNDNDKTWNDYQWNGNDIVEVIIDNNIIQGIAVNMDSFVLKKYLSKNKINSESKIKYATNKYFLSVYFHILFLYGVLEKYKKSQNNIDEEQLKFETNSLLKDVFKYYSSFLLYHDISKEIIESIEID